MAEKNIAVVFAAGFGERMRGCTRPKQFLEVHGKPVLAYTLEHFQRHEEIHGIVLVTMADWIDYCRNMIQAWKLDKTDAIIPGGDTSQESICIGLETARKLYSEKDIVLIHDGVRPLIDSQTITHCIQCVRQYGTAITVSPQMETVMMRDKEHEDYEIVERDRCQVARAPQCFYLRDILDVQRKALREHMSKFIDCASLMEYYGHSLHAVRGPDDNIKITTAVDYYVFRSILEKGNGHDFE